MQGGRNAGIALDLPQRKHSKGSSKNRIKITFPKQAPLYQLEWEILISYSPNYLVIAAV